MLKDEGEGKKPLKVRGSSDLGLPSMKETGKEGVSRKIGQRGVLEPRLHIKGVSQLNRNGPIAASLWW